MKTDYRFKLLYAVGMILIVAGHCYNGGFDLLYDWFPAYPVHLGIFVFASGYFYNSKSENASVFFILKKIKKLLIPLFLWNVFYGILVWALSFKGFTFGRELSLYNLFVAPVTDGHQFGLNLGGWFVIPLFMTQIWFMLTHRITKLFKNINVGESVYFVISLVLGCLGVFLSTKGYNTGWWLVLVSMLFFVPFFSLGYFYKAVAEKYDNLPSFWYFIIIFALKIAIMLYLGYSPTYVPSWCADFNDGILTPFIVTTLGIAFWLRVCRLFADVIGKNKYINLIADNTYSIMINQYLGFFVLNTVYAVFNKLFGVCHGFDFVRYKTMAEYMYLPKNLFQMGIVYCLAGITVPILMQFAINKFVKLIKKK